MNVDSTAIQSSYTPSELMVAAAAREIRDGEVISVGMRLPLIAFLVAKRTHAPHAIGLFENGVIRDTPASELIYTMSDPPNICGAVSIPGTLGVMSLLQSGYVDLGILGAAEADKYGNLNSTQVRADDAHGSPDRFTRLPGSGGACDIASCAKRFIVLLEHSNRRLPERVSYITSPGYGDGGDWRQRVGLPRGGPSACITTKAVLRYFDPASPHPGFARDRVPDHGEAYLASVHPGVTVEDVVTNTGWELRVPDNIVETSPPTAEELAAIRDYDKEGFWTK